MIRFNQKRKTIEEEKARNRKKTQICWTQLFLKKLGKREDVKGGKEEEGKEGGAGHVEV